MASAGARIRLPLSGESRRALTEHAPPPPPAWAPPSELADGDGRLIQYLRLSITDRCDMACVYCMPPGGEHEHGLREELLSFEEIARLVRVLVPRGLRRVRLTGGEPLVRRDVVSLVGRIREAGVDDVWITTNGSRLAPLARGLRSAGLVGVNVSIDSLDPSRFAQLTRGGVLADVIAGIDSARAEGLSVRTNTVVIRDENLAELEGIVRWAWGRAITPRLIELMPIGEGARLPERARVGVDEMRAALSSCLAPGGSATADVGRGPARYLASRDDVERRVGFITAVSDEFCASCNRMRLTAQGEVRACLASRRAVSLRELLRAGASDHDIAWAIQWALAGKARGHAFAVESPARPPSSDADHARVGMSLIGG